MDGDVNPAAVVVDASALIEVLLQTPRAPRILAAVGSAEMVAPDLITVEVLSVLRRLVRHAHVGPERGEQAVDDFLAAPVRRFPLLHLALPIWQLRDTLSAYDACYVALAQALGCSLITSDERLARAPGLPVSVVVP